LNAIADRKSRIRPDPHRRIQRSADLDAEVRCTAAGAIHDQELMFNEHGLGKDRTQTAGADDPENCGDEMDEENNEIAHVRIVTRQNHGRFSPNLRIRHPHVEITPSIPAKYKRHAWRRSETVDRSMDSCCAVASRQ